MRSSTSVKNSLRNGSELSCELILQWQARHARLAVCTDLFIDFSREGDNGYLQVKYAVNLLKGLDSSDSGFTYPDFDFVCKFQE